MVLSKLLLMDAGGVLSLKALVYLLGILGDTRRHFKQIYDIKKAASNQSVCTRDGRRAEPGESSGWRLICIQTGCQMGKERMRKKGWRSADSILSAGFSAASMPDISGKASSSVTRIYSKLFPLKGCIAADR